MTRLNINDLEEVEEDTSYISVVRRILVALESQKEDWRKTSIFEILVVVEKRLESLSLRVLYDRDVEHNGKANTYSFKFNDKHIVLKPLSAKTMKKYQEQKSAKEEDSKPKMVIEKKKALQIFSKKSFEMESKKQEVVFVLLYDRDVEHNGKANTYSFKFNDKHIVLKPLSAKTMKKYQEQKSAKEEDSKPKMVIEKKKALQIFSKKSFEMESKKQEVVFVLEGDEVMVRIRPERYPKSVYKKLHSKSTGPFKIIKKINSNTYVLELPEDMGISNIFNIENFTSYA
ncbi:hypothetical protein ACH5RR_030380 [Cinchona calisaya]|uniref:Tf2-1-like SH3-like domain-containing protein n=1 Tax=Cinchona calisaya TaxID=153742 RepID=A0ABD2YVS9_9GENT